LRRTPPAGTPARRSASAATGWRCGRARWERRALRRRPLIADAVASVFPERFAAAHDGSAEIDEDRNLPLTGEACVDRIITDLAVIDVTADTFPAARRAAGVTVPRVVAATAAPLQVTDDVPTIAQQAPM
jgi:hypothetical protein